MSQLNQKTLQVSRQVEQLRVPVMDLPTEGDAPTVHDRIPLTLRIRHKALRVAPPIDDGFRPFRVF
jgi:hypothetical protein